MVRVPVGMEVRVVVEIGVIGPRDLVDQVTAGWEEPPGVIARRVGYERESQAAGLVAAHANQVRAWLFTGLVPFHLAQDAGALTRPATYVDYTGAALLQAVVHLLRAGHDPARVSVDTVPNVDVAAAFAAAGLPMDAVRTLPYRSGMTTADVVAFHRRCRRGTPRSSAALTCLDSVPDALGAELPVLRLAPTAHAVRAALHQLVRQAGPPEPDEAQLALGLVELPGDGPGLAAEAAALGGSVARHASGAHLLVTTEGALREATAGYTALPMLRRLADQYQNVRIGFGLGCGAIEAERLASRALSRARQVGGVAAVLAIRGGTELVLDSRAPGLPAATLLRLREAQLGAGAGPLTSREVADRLGVQPRTARRLLHRLERAGMAERLGTLTSGGSGRPHTLYRLTL